jgi:hypothetical protein
MPAQTIKHCAAVGVCLVAAHRRGWIIRKCTFSRVNGRIGRHADGLADKPEQGEAPKLHCGRDRKRGSILTGGDDKHGLEAGMPPALDGKLERRFQVVQGIRIAKLVAQLPELIMSAETFIACQRTIDPRQRGGRVILRETGASH